ncbi:hypothetical protein BOTBODRAFT_29620 [Botryobasidium botryosum FD-172 SS1]|uniref:non-specific serine/threonine protein kinase n=1 Tax=Botryobasidium botryosum (strain FD-172 SS1) TaxID=930990 RepID=A0A067N3C8_BOTB1|nr:hypothetical protein BOTBODRAFT_29620 [Botryobasidium botryosum FD-172 SS1]
MLLYNKDPCGQTTAAPLQASNSRHGSTSAASLSRALLQSRLRASMPPFTQAFAQPPQQIPQQQPNHGTLIPGQVITLTQQTVKVEKYLSQGGFAHVYLVKTSIPIFGTTHHVLKRMAVPDSAMLAEVRKEVEVMQILRGHPNIVHIIDAASYPLANGAHEVFILMEFCQGGGIIDMMNRRLRERLAEHEILQVFVDVCEGVAYMHSRNPPLLHRDLKVENILQASVTSYKLCDFGSTTRCPTRPPANHAEVMALEMDLNRHTTLQYRSPEMVDPHLRRIVDEKSDIWALGVLLYKLCYYTTPFEEHGPLAILNVSYKIPPYPVYSGQMINLIGSMLRELGTQRPNIFEVLDVVHQMRRTTSAFNYSNRPQKETFAQAPMTSPNIRPLQAPGPSNAELARKHVLDAIQPMRRGRPEVAPAPIKPIKSGPMRSYVPKSPPKPTRPLQNGREADAGAWNIAGAGSAADAKGSGSSRPQEAKYHLPAPAFDGFADSFTFSDSSLGSTLAPSPALSSRRTPSPSNTPTPTRTSTTTVRPRSRPTSQHGLGLSAQKRDAFEGLGVAFGSGSPSRPQSLGRSMSSRASYLAPSISPAPVTRKPVPPIESTVGGTGLPRRLSPGPTIGTTAITSPNVDLSVEERYPSIEDLDKDTRFNRSYGSSAASGSSAAPAPSHATPQRAAPPPRRSPSTSRPSLGAPQLTRNNLTGVKGLESSNSSLGFGLGAGANMAPGGAGASRSQQVTGTAMRESRRNEVSSGSGSGPGPGDSQRDKQSSGAGVATNSTGRDRPLSRRPSSSYMGKRASMYSAPLKAEAPEPARVAPAPVPAQEQSEAPRLPPRPAAGALGQSQSQKDWLTGDDEPLSNHLKTPSQRAAERASPRPSPRHLPSPLPSESASTTHVSGSSSPTKRSSIFPSGGLSSTGNANVSPTKRSSGRESPSRMSVFKSPSTPLNGGGAYRAGGSPSRKGTGTLTESSSDEGPEEPVSLATLGRVRDRVAAANQIDGHQRETSEAAKPQRLPSQHAKRTSVYDLIDFGKSGAPESPTKGSSGFPRRAATRQTSVHDLIDMGSKSPTPLSSPRMSHNRQQSMNQQWLDSRPSMAPPRRLTASPDRDGGRSSPHGSPSRSSQALPQTSSSSAFSPARRPRPQSMFISIPSGQDSSMLSVPDEPASSQTRRPVATRRGSISDIVSKYEALRTGGSGTTTTTTVGASTTQTPVATSSRFNKTPSPVATNYPLRSKPPEVGLSMETGVGVASRTYSIRRRPSPTPTLTSVASLATASESAGSMTKPEPVRSRPIPSWNADSRLPQAAISSEGLSVNNLAPEPARTASPDPPPPRSIPPSPSPHSPAPERPYQGVGKLIDQWQRKTEEAAESARKAPLRRPLKAQRGGFV